MIDQLLSNAIKYTRQGGVTIRVCRTGQPGSHENTGDGEKAAGGVRIVIGNTGIGIRAENLLRVCEKGYTGYNGHADKYSTGIGLYLCRAILDKLGHSFSITSEQGKGTKAEVIIV